MPLIQVKLIEEVFTPAQKKEMITKLTDAMVIRRRTERQITIRPPDVGRDDGISEFALLLRNIRSSAFHFCHQRIKPTKIDEPQSGFQRAGPVDAFT